jgi:peroxisomal 2,4-dienoyl-CoA reductase
MLCFVFVLRGQTWYQAHASAAKAAIDSLTRSYGLEWSEFGIRTVGIAPGNLLHFLFVKCQQFYVSFFLKILLGPIAATAGMAKLGGGIDEQIIASTVPAKRLGRTWDIASYDL